MTSLDGLDSFVHYDCAIASLHKDQRGMSPFWYCAFISKEGSRHFRSTKTKDRRQAVQICSTWAKAAALVGRLPPDEARQVIAQGAADSGAG
jgi:hypothetical protein